MTKQLINLEASSGFLIIRDAVNDIVKSIEMQQKTLSPIDDTTLIIEDSVGNDIYAIFWENAFQGGTPFTSNTDVINWITTNVVTAADGGGGGGATLSAPITVTNAQGNYNSGDVIAAGTPLEDIDRNILEEILLPTFSPNSVSVSGLVGGVQEIGTLLNATLAFNYNAGVINSRNGAPDIDLTGAANNQVFNGIGVNPATGVVSTNVVSGSNPYSVQVSYDAGTGAYFDSNGDPENNLDALRVAGSIVGNYPSLVGRDRYWVFVGAENGSPVTSPAVRALTDTGFESGTFTFDVTIPANTKEVSVYTKGNLDSVLFVESSNADVTGTFTETSVNVENAGGVPSARKQFKTVIGGTGYPSVATYRVTITI